MNHNKLRVFSGRANRRWPSVLPVLWAIISAISRWSHSPTRKPPWRIEEDVRGRDVFIVQPTCPPVNGI